MAGRNLFQYKAQARQYTRWVWLASASGVTKNLGVCYDRDYGTAANADQARDTYVNLPDNTNNLAFAGVVADTWGVKNDGQGGQMVMIYEPGSVCQVTTTAAVTIGDILTCVAGGSNAGKFSPLSGFWGRGSARALQTLTDAGTCLVELLDGPESGLVEIVAPVAGAATFMVGGVTRFGPAATIATNMTFTLADGKFWGMRKGFECDGAITTGKIVVTVAGKQADDSTALTTISFDADDESAHLEWVGRDWKLVHSEGATLAST